MKTTEITNDKLRNQVENSNDDIIQFNVNPKDLLDLGWVFDDSIDYYMENNENLFREDAEKMFDDDCIIYIRIKKFGVDEITTTYEINNYEHHLSRISNGDSQWTGDDEQTIRDIELLFFQ